MTSQLGLFDGFARRDEAIARVDAHAPEEWKTRALDAVYRVASAKEYFAADDIWATGLEKPHEPRAMGPVMMRAVRLGYCQTTPSYRPTANVTQHAQPIRVYRSAIYRAGNGAAINARPSAITSRSGESATEGRGTIEVK